MEQAKDFDLLRRVYGRAHLKTPDFYVEQACANGMKPVQFEDISKATQPTFARWRENAQRWNTEIEQRVGPDYLQDFIESTIVLDRLWSNGTLGYLLFAADS